MNDAAAETDAVLTVGVHEAKTKLSRLLKLVESGNQIVVSRGGVPVARLVPEERPGPRELGVDAGLFKVPQDFDAPLPDEEVDIFYS